MTIAKLNQEQIDAIEPKAYVDGATVRTAMQCISPSWTLAGHLASGGVFRRGSLQVFFSVL